MIDHVLPHPSTLPFGGECPLPRASEQSICPSLVALTVLDRIMSEVGECQGVSLIASGTASSLMLSEWQLQNAIQRGLKSLRMTPMPGDP